MSPLQRTVAAAESSARIFLDEFPAPANDPTEGDWDSEAWAIDTSGGGSLSDLDTEQCEQLWPVYCAALVYVVRSVRP